MNILYIGPYRQNNLNGWTDICVLQHLINNSKHNITCRPIYIDNASPSKNIPTDIESKENTAYTHYDVIIQRASMNYLCPIKKIAKNIALPIIDNKLMDQESIETLNTFESVLVDSPLSYAKLSLGDKFKKNKLKTYSYNISINNLNIPKFNIGLWNFAKKLYFIGDYEKNITNIYNLIRAFIKNVKHKDYSLLLFLFNLTPNQKNSLDAFIQQIYSLYNVNYSVNKIILIPIESSLSNLVSAHRTGDIYIDLQDNICNSLNTSIAKQLNNNIISFDIGDVIFSFERNQSTEIEGFIGVGDKAIDKAVESVVNDNHHENKPYKKFDLVDLI